MVAFTVSNRLSPELDNLRPLGNDSFIGNLENLRVIHRPDGIYCSGSIVKYLQGENVTTLTLKTVKEALLKLEDITGWDLKETELKQVEIGATIPVKLPACYYLASWGTIPRFLKHTYQRNTLETITFSTKDRSFTGYDKKLESNNIPSIYSGTELIRLELRYKRALKRRMKQKLSLWDLTDKNVYLTLVSHWRDAYFSIPKSREVILNTTENISPKDLDNALKLYGLQQIGIDNYLILINSLAQRGTLGAVQAGRSRKNIRDLEKDPRISQPAGLIKELDAKVRAQAVYV